MIGLLTTLGLSQRIARIAAPVIGVVAAIALVWALVAYIGHIKDQRDEALADLRAANAEIELLKLDADLRETAATERETDNRTISEQKKELSDARNHQGDDANSRRIRRLCVVMRQQGRDTDSLPACAGLDGAVGAGTAG